MGSGAGTNLKLGGTGPEQKWEGTDPERSAEKNFFGHDPPVFGSKSTISRFGEHFCDSQYSLVSFLFAVLLLTVFPVPSHLYKWGGGTWPRAPWSRRHCLWGQAD